jgi:cytochrome c
VAQTVKPVSVWSGVYTAAQNKRGEEVHASSCVMCHGPRLNGAGQPEMPPSPAIARATFLRKFSGQPISTLFVIVRHTMPPDAPGTLSDQQAIDAIAHMLAVSDMPPGNSELLPDVKVLTNILIEAQPK